MSDLAAAVECGKMRSLTVRNFRCIGPKGVKVDLDDIVVLVGPNNSGKSSILRAYEIAMSEGSNAGKIKMEDFPEGKVSESNPVEIEIVTEVISGNPGKQWLGGLDGSEVESSASKYVKERWVWVKEGKGTRQGWNVHSQSWDDKKPWGWAGVANARRPAVHPVRAFDPPESQSKQIHELLRSALMESAKKVSKDGVNLYEKLIKDIGEFQKIVLGEDNSAIESAESALNQIVSSIFLDHTVEYIQPADAPEDVFRIFAQGGKLTMGHKDGHRSDLESQGSGARRTMLWATLKYIKDTTQEGNKSNVLLIDEPELCLHPSAVRDACNVLYELASKDGWQIMLTTHSPVFIDLSRDNTTIVRVERKDVGEIIGTTLYRPESARLTKDDKSNFKIMTSYDPYVGEFFFGGRIVVVEGDTEYAAFKMLASEFKELSDVHIIRARGKATIASMAKVLNQFGASYSIIHDSDTPKAKRKNRSTGEVVEINNPAWSANEKILSEVEGRLKSNTVRLVASIINFEHAFFDTSLTSEKPYSAVSAMREDRERKEIIKKLLDALLDHSKPLPSGCLDWSDINQLHSAVQAVT